MDSLPETSGSTPLAPSSKHILGPRPQHSSTRSKKVLRDPDVEDNRTLDSKTEQVIAVSESRRRKLRANLAALTQLLLKNFQLATTVQQMQITTTPQLGRRSPNQQLFGEVGVSIVDEISQPLCAILCNLGAASNLLGAGPLELSEILADVHADTLRACEIVKDMRICSAEKLPEGTPSA